MIDSLKPKSCNDRIRGVEPMMDRTVTVFGQGHFGTPLTARLREISPEGVSILPVAKRENNKEAAFHSGLSVLTVRPEQVAQTLSDIKIPLNTDAQVLSFAANVSDKDDVSLRHLEQLVHRPVARMMTAPGGSIAAYVLGEGFSKGGYEFIFNYLTRMKPIELKSDRALDKYTILLAHMHVAQLLKGVGLIENADKHIRFVLGKLGIDPEKFGRYEVGDDPPEIALEKIATPGGVSERFIKIFRDNPRISPESVFENVLRDIDEARARAGITARKK